MVFTHHITSCEEWLAHKFMAYGKGCGNSMIRWLALYQKVTACSNSPGLATPELMATGKETSNPFTVLSMIRFPLLEVMRPVCNFCTYCHGRSGGSKLVAVKTLLGLSLVADLIHCYMFTLLLIHSFKTQQGQAGCLLAVAAVAVKSSLLNFCGAFI
ncbi:hypothetical protein Tco_0179674 [Tanacetum coccineum]